MLDAIAVMSGLLLMIFVVAGLPCAYLSGVTRRRTSLIRPGTEHTCAACRYDLSGLPTDAACPECGGPERGVPTSTWWRPGAFVQFSHRAFRRTVMTLLIAYVVALAGSIGMNLAWAGLYWWEGWPRQVIFGYGLAGLRDPVPLVAIGIWYLGAALLVMPWVAAYRRRTGITIIAVALAAVMASHAILVLVCWIRGGKLLAGSFDGGLEVGMLPVIVGMVLALACATDRGSSRRNS